MTAAALVVPAALAGCGALGLETTVAPNPSPPPAPGPVSGAGWLVSDLGSATPNPSAGRATGTRAPLLPPVSFLPFDPACGKSYTVEPVLIAMTIVPGNASLTVSWTKQYASDYRITAVPQALVAGEQKATTWQSVPAPAGCAVTATIKGLKSGQPYVVWLDAPNSGHYRDGTRHPYAGESAVVYPK